MAEQQKKKENDSEGALISAAKAIGSAAGKIASLAGAAPAKPAYKEGTFEAKYIGSGTFLITKPKRKRAKLRQSRLKGTVRGARK